GLGPQASGLRLKAHARLPGDHLRHRSGARGVPADLLQRAPDALAVGDGLGRPGALVRRCPALGHAGGGPRRLLARLDPAELGRALSIGVAQAAALVPGVSRSGATITLGLFQDFTRDEIARFSFLMSTPIIFGAGLVKLPKMLHEMRSGEGPVTWAALAVGFVAAAIVGVAVIRWMLAWLRTRTYAVFAIYRIALAAVIVVV